MSQSEDFFKRDIYCLWCPLLNEAFSSFLRLSPKKFLDKVSNFINDSFPGAHFLFLVSLQKGKIYIAPRATKIYNSKEIKRIIVSKDTGKLERFVEQKEGKKIVKVFPLVYRKKGIGYLVGIFDNERVCEGFEKIDDEYLFLTHISSLLWGVFQGEKLVRENVALKEAIRRLEKSLKLQTIGEIASSVAHEFKNILQSLESNLEIVGSELELAYAHSDRCLNLPAVINELKKANKAIDEGNMIVERLRGFVSRKEEFKPVNIRVLLSEVLDFVNPVIKNKERKYHKSIKLELISASDVYVMGSALKLKEVITNLILNGVDAISKEGVIQIGTQVKGKYVTIMVSDNGCGMSTSVKRRVFTPYFTTKKDGTGLGLALSLRFIKDHKGKIEFESVKGKGTVFKVILPIYRKAEDLKVERGDEEKYKVGKGVIPIKPVIGNLRFLIVDDNDIYRESLAKLLSARGFYVFGAKTKNEAVMAASGISFDIALVDISIQNDDGREVGRFLQGVQRDILVIMCTGSIEETDYEKLEFPVLKKPFKYQELLNLITALIKNREAA